MLFISIGLFLVGSVMCGFAWSMVSLIAFRVVQGAGAGGLVPVAQTVIGDMYTPVERARLQGYVSSVWAVGSILGPLVGAFLIAHTIWPMVFWVNVPIGAVAAGMLLLWLHENLQPRQHRIDYRGAALMMAGSFVLMFALVQAIHLGLAVFGGLLALSFAPPRPFCAARAARGGADPAARSAQEPHHRRRHARLLRAWAPSSWARRRSCRSMCRA